MYLAYDKTKREEVVIKVNSRDDINDHEFKTLQDLEGIDGFPRVIQSGEFKGQPYII